MITHITFSDENMTISARLCSKSATDHGCDNSYLYNKLSYSDEFYQLNKSTLDQPRGAGYWLWKPYIIFSELQDMKNGDILIYSDAGLTFNAHIKHIISGMDQDLFLFGNTHPHGRWIKMDVAQAMGITKEEHFTHEQAQASVILIKKTDFALNFISEWLRWAQVPGFIDDSPSKLPNRPEFIENRHDQAILTNLALKYGIRLHWWAAQYNRGNKVKYTDSFPFPLFLHHRRRNNEYINPNT
jgi:hypothetical protein